MAVFQFNLFRAGQKICHPPRQRMPNLIVRAASHHNGISHRQHLKFFSILRQIPRYFSLSANHPVLTHRHNNRYHRLPLLSNYIIIFSHPIASHDICQVS